MKKHIKTQLFILLTFFSLGIYAQDVAVNIGGAVSTIPGGSLTYKIYVTNNSTSNAANVTLIAPAVSNFTATSVTCANGPGNGASSVCPASVTLAGLQGSGLIIPSLPSGSAVVLTVTGTASSTPGNISYTATATFGATDTNPSNNSVTFATQIASNTGCGQSIYTLNLAQTTSTNSVSVNGGTVNLVYSLSSGSPVSGIGSSFTVPVTYSDLNSHNGTNHQWYSIVNEASGVNLGMATYNNNTPSQTADPGSIYNGLPTNNIKPSPGLFNPYSYLNVDGTLTNALRTGSINPLGTFTLNFGNITLPTDVRIVTKSLILQGRGSMNGSSADPDYIASSHFAKPIIQNTFSTDSSNTSPEIEMEFGQTYTWRYTAFATVGLARQHNRRGVVFKSGSITFAYECPCNAGTTQVPLNGNVLTN